MDQLSSFYPQIILSVGILIILISGIRKKNPGWLKKQTTIISLSFLILAAVVGATGTDHAAMDNLFRLDTFTRFFLLFAIFSAGATIILASQSLEISGRRFPEFAALLITICIGISLMAAADDLLVAYLAMETVSLASYVLTGFKKTHRISHEAALKYVIFGGVASGIMVFGMSLLYGLAGTTSFAGIASILLNQNPFLGSSSVSLFAVTVALIMVLTGICFKIAAVPFHMWCPDVYQGAPTPFTGFLSVAPKAAGFALLLRLVVELLPQADSSLKGSFIAIIGLISAVTMTLGNFTAIHQMNVKRLLAYSSIAHAGYLLMGITVLDQTGSNAVLFYLAVYLFMNLGAFAMVQTVVDILGSEDLSAFRGLGYRLPLAAISMAIFLVSLAGIPPLAGFIGKFYLFAAIIKEGGFWYILLAVIGILNSVIALFYYARILREMYLRGIEIESPLKANRLNQAVMLVGSFAIIILGLYWEPLQTLVSGAVTALWLP